MKINIIKDNRYNDKEIPKNIHGKYPYKYYLEIRGNSNIGRYIAVISDKNLCINKEDIDEISIKIKEEKKRKLNSNNIVKPNMIGNSLYITYKVREVSILDVQNIPMEIYRNI